MFTLRAILFQFDFFGELNELFSDVRVRVMTDDGVQPTLINDNERRWLRFLITLFYFWFLLLCNCCNELMLLVFPQMQISLNKGNLVPGYLREWDLCHISFLHRY